MFNFFKKQPPQNSNLSEKQIEKMLEKAKRLDEAAHYESAFELYKQAADAGHPRGCRAAGYCYLYGEGTECDQEKGLKYLQHAGVLGDSQASLILAKFYSSEQLSGEKKSPTKANMYLLEAAQHHNKEAMLMLGRAYYYCAERFDIKKVDMGSVEYWMAPAMEAANADDFGILADACSFTDQPERAMQYLKEAINRKHIGSMITMADIYFFNTSVAKRYGLGEQNKDFDKGDDYLRLAMETAFEKGKSFLNKPDELSRLYLDSCRGSLKQVRARYELLHSFAPEQRYPQLKIEQIDIYLAELKA